ncbi:MAG: hypothetical protein HY675_00840 [Chloroflexi bacterium]|nr:hypothetical protein [Chloroflexota bacterium]
MNDRVIKLALAAIVGAYLLLAVLYAQAIPKWNAPDEPSHFNYIRNVAERREFPVLQVGDYDFDYLEKAKAAKFPDTMPVDRIRYESHQPPLYYTLAAPLYLLTMPLSLNVQVLLLRLFSTALGALTILTAYWTARRMFPNEALVFLGVPAFAAFVPMHTAMTAAINNDALGNLLLSVILLVLAGRLVSCGQPEGAPAPTATFAGSRSSVPPCLRGFVLSLASEPVVLGGLLGLGLLTKTTTYIAIVLIAYVILCQELAGGVRLRAFLMSTKRLFGIGLIALLISGWWFVRNASMYGDLDILARKRHDLVVAGQPLTGIFDWPAASHFVTVSFRSFWAQFGWMGILVDNRIYLLYAVLSAVALVGLTVFGVRALLRPRRVFQAQGLLLGLLLLCYILLLGGVVQYNLIYVQAQGRYLFPAIVPIATFFVLGWRELLPVRWRSPVFLVLFAGLMVLNIAIIFRHIVPSFG